MSQKTPSPENCFYYSEFISKQQELLRFVQNGQLSCSSQTHWCDAKTPIYLSPGSPQIDISCTFPNCPLEAIKNRFQTN